MSNIIVVDGPNNVGKSTFIKEFLKTHEDFISIHTDSHDANDLKFYNCCLSEMKNIIYDRLHISESIYPFLDKRRAKITFYEFSQLCTKFKNIIYIFITADDDFVKQAYANKKEQYNKEYYKKEKVLFETRRSELCNMGCNVIHIYNTIDTVKDNTLYLLNTIDTILNKQNRLQKGYADDAGIDILLDKAIELPPMSTTVIDLNISITPRVNTMAYLVARTSAAIQGLIVASCPIDPNYKGTINCIVHNVSNKLIKYEKNEALCQIVFVPILANEYSVNIKKEGKRTDGKFGSTNNAEH